MLKIQVLGKGLIPRGYGLAPRTEPFSADLTLISTILATPGLKVNMIRPEDEKAITLTAQNLKRMWETYTDAHLRAPRATVPQTSPAVPASATNVPAAAGGIGHMGEPSKEKPVVVTPPATATPVVPEKIETPAADVKTDSPAEKKDETPATDAKIENKTNEQKPGYVIKPINNDDKRNGNNNSK